VDKYSRSEKEKDPIDCRFRDGPNQLCEGEPGKTTMVLFMDMWHPQRYIGMKRGLPETIFPKALISHGLICQINNSCGGR
jgi:hypothetical protein